MTILVCPECFSEKVTVTQEQTFMVNTGEHFCFSVKTHDDISQATCLDCWWKGTRVELKEMEE